MKKIFTFIAALAVAASVNAQQLYLIGDAPLGDGWKTEAPIPMNLAADGYTNSISVELTGGKWFAICTAPTATANDWDTMNGELRWAPSSNPSAPTKEQTNLASGEYQLYNGFEGTMYIGKGEWTLTVDARTMKLTVTSSQVGPIVDTYVVAGSSAELFGNTWAGEDDNNAMVKQADGTYKKTYDGVTLTAGDIMFKIVLNGGTWIPDGQGNDNVLNIPEDGTYNVVFTYDPAGDPSKEGLTTTAEATNTTGINEVKAAQTVPTVFYNLKGQRVNANTKGILIANGKKFIR